jgi:ADP-ribose pyrophosphatase YjhB (NUDIX family)
LNFIPTEEYRQILHHSINLCVDVLLRYDYRYLLIKRTEEPCKDVYWPIGGRVHKLETSLDAAKRKIKEEIGIDFTAELTPIGFYEDVYEKNSFGDGPYHTLSTVWLGHLTKKEFKNIKLDSTASEYKLDKHMPERFKVQTFADYGRPYWYLDSIGKSENEA